jgi:MFS family permease
MTDPTAPVAPTAPAALGSRDVLRIPDFRRLWAAQGISDIGDGLTMLTLMLLVNELTGSTLALAAVAIALAVPPLTIGLVAGTYADRWDRRRIMLVSDSLRAVVVLGFIVIDSASMLPALLALAFVQASIGTFFSPARGALVPRVVPAEGLLAANAVTQATRVIAGVIGAGLAGLIVGTLGEFWPAFVLDAATFLMSVAIVYGVDRRAGAPTDAAQVAAAGVGSSLVDGLRIVAGSRALWVTLAALGMAMFGLGAVNVLFLPLLVRVLDVSPVWIGAVDFAQSASMVLSASLVGLVAARFRPTSIVTGGLIGIGVVVALAGQSTSLIHVLVLLFLMGWLVTPAQAAIVTIMQTGVDDASRGRVMATLQASMSGAAIASMLFAGVFGDLLGVRTVFLLAGAIVIAGGLVALVLYRGIAPDEQTTLPGRPGTTAERASV